MPRYLAIYRLTARNSLIREMSFKLNFLLWIIVELLWFLGQLVFIEVLYGQVQQIGGWSKWQLVTLVGVHQIISQLFQAFFYLNLAALPELIRTGRLDILLTLPLDAQFAISTRQVSFDSLLNVPIGIGIVTFSLVKMSLLPSLTHLLLAAVAIVLGVAVHYAVMLGLACISFWSVRAGFIHGYFSLFMIGRYPQTIFRGAFRFLFTWIVPVIWVSNLPAELLARPFESPWMGLLALTTGTATVLAATRALWLYALRRYASASS